MADAGVGETAAAEGAKGAGEAAAGAGAADAGAGAIGAGAADAGAAGIADAGATAAGAGVADAGAGAAATGFGGVGTDAAVSGAGGLGVGAGFGGVGTDAAVTGLGTGLADTATGFGGVGTDAAATGFAGTGDAAALSAAATGGPDLAALGASDLGTFGGGISEAGGGGGIADLTAPTTTSGFGGMGTDAAVTGPSADVAGGGEWDALLKTAGRYGPAGLSLASSLINRSALTGAYGRAASQLGGVGATQRGTADALVAGYNNGTLNPAENAKIDQWATQQVAALRQFYANSGTADSTQAKMAEAAVQAQAVQMKNQAAQDLLKVGLTELNGLDANTVAAINLNLKGDLAAEQAQANFAEQFAKLIGSTQTPSSSTGP